MLIVLNLLPIVVTFGLICQRIMVSSSSEISSSCFSPLSFWCRQQVQSHSSIKMPCDDYHTFRSRPRIISPSLKTINFAGEKKYQCHFCGKSFALKSYLNKHIEKPCNALKTTSQSLWIQPNCKIILLLDDIPVFDKILWLAIPTILLIYIHCL